MLKREDLSDEIRINQKYTHLYSAEYPKTKKGESTPIIHKKALLTRDYLRRMSVNMGAGMRILPPNCRYLEKVSNGSIAVIEEPPAFRTVRIRMSYSDEYNRLKESGKLEEYEYDDSWASTSTQDRTFTLAFPYVIFIIHINESNQLSAGQVYFRVARMTGLSDYIMKAPLNNISDNQFICFGSGGGTHATLNAAIENTINMFWAAQFNTDYMYNYGAYREVAGVNTYMEWHALSQRDPMFIYNVKWINMAMNIGQAIDEVKRQYSLTAPSDMQYKTLSQMFSTPLTTGKEIKPTKRSRKKHPLYYDVAEGMFLDHDFYVHVGDPFMIKNGKETCHINSMISFMDTGDVKYIRVERQDGRLITYRLTKVFKKYLLDKVKELRYEAEGTLKNGVVVKDGDIIEMKTPNGKLIYRKVASIRKTQEGFHEGQFGDGFYILEHTEGQIFDVGKPIYKGIELQEDNEYLYCNVTEVPICSGSVTKYAGINTDRRGTLTIEMKEVGRTSSPFKVSLNRSDPGVVIHDIIATRPLPPLYRVGRKIMFARDGNGKPLEKGVFGTPHGVVYDRNCHHERPTPEDVKKYIMTEDGIHIESFDMDIDFKIGDKVVIADWENPINMLSIKTIQGFRFTEDRGDIAIITADKHGNVHTTPYIDIRNQVIFTGRIRKISNSHGRLKAGTKIQAKIAGIPHFPKKDVNIIIGFITDTDGAEPLVLCSNCCTLWYNDVVENFTKTTMKAKKWATMPHAAIDVSKIKYQPGDIILGVNDYRNTMGWFVFKMSGTKALRMHDIAYYTQYPDYYSIDRYVIANSRLDCIPNPRMATKDVTEGKSKTGWLNFHGLFFPCEQSRFRFLEDGRSMINV